MPKTSPPGMARSAARTGTFPVPQPISTTPNQQKRWHNRVLIAYSYALACFSEPKRNVVRLFPGVVRSPMRLAAITVAVLGAAAADAAGSELGDVRSWLYFLDVNLDETPVFDRGASGKSDTKRVNLRPYVDIQWDSNAIADAARKAGLTQVHYADLETLSVLGVWVQKTVHVYGK